MCVSLPSPCHLPLQVDVYIYEPNGISRVEVPNSLGHQFEGLTRVMSTKDKVRPHRRMGRF